MLLHRQLAIYERKQDRAPRLSRGEKLTLVVLATKLRAKTGRTIKGMGEAIRIVKPDTLFGWHKELVRLKWTYRRRNPGGRPRTDRAIERRVVRLARENDWGFERIEGELLKLDYTISHETVGGATSPTDHVGVDRPRAQHPVFDPRQRQEVYGSFRYSFPLRRHRCDPNARSRPERQRLHGAVDSIRAGRMPRQGAGHQ